MIIFVIEMRNLFLTLFSGLLLAFSWPDIGIFPLIFFAFVPLFILEDEIYRSNKGKGWRVFCLSFFRFFIFNIITTYWIYNATIFGAFAAFIINSGLMASVMYLFHKLRCKSNNKIGHIAFIFLWIGMEYLHLNWELSWPWLILGNSFANNIILVQWYEYTGFLGGTFWILVINLLIFRFINNKEYIKNSLLLMFFIIFPISISYFIYINNSDIEQKDSLEVVIIQPNVDPYNEKFNIDFEKQLEEFIELAETKLTQETQILLGPETALIEGIWEDDLDNLLNNYSIRKLIDLQENYPLLNIIIGATTYKLFKEGEKKSVTARQVRNENIFYDAYNSAIFISKFGKTQIYHKTKLVPGVEKIPFPFIFDRIPNLAINLGGISGSLGSENSITNFNNEIFNIRPLICYESIYGEMSFINSNLIAVITNDGWWKNTAGYRQHFSYARLRAIEQRKVIIRSANTGISGVINYNGDVLKTTQWDKKSIISSTVSLNFTSTFYSKYGDYIGRISAYISVLLILTVYIKNKLE